MFHILQIVNSYFTAHADSSCKHANEVLANTLRGKDSDVGEDERNQVRSVSEAKKSAS
jgi:hypothetical protein